MVSSCPIAHASHKDTAHYANYLLEGEHTMPIFFFSVKVTPASETELKEVAAPDFVRAVQTLAAWRPGIHILRLEGIHTGSPAHAGGETAGSL